MLQHAGRHIARASRRSLVGSHRCCGICRRHARCRQGGPAGRYASRPGVRITLSIAQTLGGLATGESVRSSQNKAALGSRRSVAATRHGAIPPSCRRSAGLETQLGADEVDRADAAVPARTVETESGDFIQGPEREGAQHAPECRAWCSPNHWLALTASGSAYHGLDVADADVGRAARGAHDQESPMARASWFAERDWLLRREGLPVIDGSYLELGKRPRAPSEDRGTRRA